MSHVRRQYTHQELIIFAKLFFFAKKQKCSRKKLRFPGLLLALMCDVYRAKNANNERERKDLDCD